MVLTVLEIITIIMDILLVQGTMVPEKDIMIHKDLRVIIMDLDITEDLNMIMVGQLLLPTWMGCIEIISMMGCIITMVNSGQAVNLVMNLRLAQFLTINVKLRLEEEVRIILDRVKLTDQIINMDRGIIIVELVTD